MPSIQRGQVFKLTGGSWAFRYYENGRRRQQGGYETKGQASHALTEALRRARLGPDLVARTGRSPNWSTGTGAAPGCPSDARPVAGDAREGLATFGEIPVVGPTSRRDRRMADEDPGGTPARRDAGVPAGLEAAVKWKVIPENPANLVRNPLPKREEIRPFETWADVDAVAASWADDGCDRVFAAATGFGRRSGSRSNGATSTWVNVPSQSAAPTPGGVLRDWGKTDRSRRRVPLRQKAVDALEQLPRRLDTRLVFPALRGSHMNLHNWRSRDWKPAVRHSIAPERRIYDLRHTYATWSFAAVVSLFSLARRTGTAWT